MPTAPTEKELDIALAHDLESPGFLHWFLSRTKFANRGAAFVSCRANHPWGIHPFPYTDPATGICIETSRQSETDVLLILRAEDGEVLSVHIENKIGSGSFTVHQPEMYAHRARHWIGNEHYGRYTDFDTVLVAPSAFLARNVEQAKHFGAVITHEEMTSRAPLFGVSGADA